MKRAIALTLLLATTSALLSACIVVPPRDGHYHYHDRGRY
jgi:starvation-inducible outer membrane lipoprotein